MAQGRVALVMAAVIGLLLISPASLNADEYRVLEGDTPYAPPAVGTHR